MLKDSSETLKDMPQGLGRDKEPYDDNDESTLPALSITPDTKTLAPTEPDQAVTPTTPDVGPPPDGGREAWSCAFSGGWVTFCLMGFGEYPAIIRSTYG